MALPLPNPNVINNAVTAASVGAAARSAQNNSSSANVLVQGLQVLAALGSANPATGLALNPAAGVVTGAQVATDLRNGTQVSGSDITAMAGNAVAIIAAVGMAAGAPVLVPTIIIGGGLLGAGYLADDYNSSPDPTIGTRLADYFHPVDPILNPTITHDPSEYDPGFAPDWWPEDIMPYRDPLTGRILPKKPDPSDLPFCRKDDPYDPDDPIGAGGGKAGDKAQEGDGGSGLVDPFVLDLNGDGIHFIAPDESQAYFDLTGNGFATRNAWISAEDGILTIDVNGDGQVNDIGELFGSAEQTGFSVLAALDTNDDGVIDLSDAAFGDLKIWKDANGDGISQAEELKTLEETGIASIGIGYEDVPTSGEGTQAVRQGSFTRTDGTSGQTADVVLESNPTYSRFVGDVEIDPEVFAVGNVKGYGTLADFHIALSQNADLKEYALDLFAEESALALVENFQTLLAKWAEAEGVTIDEIDAQHALNVNADGKVVFPLVGGYAFTLEELRIIQRYSGLETLTLRDGHWWEDAKELSTGVFYDEAWETLTKNLIAKFAVANGLTAAAVALAEISPEDSVYAYSHTRSCMAREFM